MSMRALLEIIVHLESFRNIDIFFQGLYYIQIKLYQKKEVVHEAAPVSERRQSLWQSSKP